MDKIKNRKLKRLVADYARSCRMDEMKGCYHPSDRDFIENWNKESKKKLYKYIDSIKWE